jgi:hypothetical protein
MLDAFLRQRAVDLTADPAFDRFLGAFQSVAGSEAKVVRAAFVASDGTVEDVLRHVLATSSRRAGDDLHEVLEDARNVGATPAEAEVTRLERELAQSKSDLVAWYAFMDGRN